MVWREFNKEELEQVSDCRVLCGDALSILPDLQEKSVDLCVTAPSYYCRGGPRIPEVWGMEATIEDYMFRIVSAVNEIHRTLKPNGVLWLVMSLEDARSFLKYYEPFDVLRGERRWAYRIDHSWIDTWSSIPTRNRIMAFYKSVPKILPKRKHIKASSTRSVAHTEPQTKKRVGYAAFPAIIPRTAIKAHCAPGGTVIDPFMGQGTTLEVAKKIGRKAIGIEIAPEMCEYVKRQIIG